MQDTYNGWTGIRTGGSWVLAIVLCLFVPGFFLACLIYLGWRLIAKKRGGDAGIIPYAIFVGLVVFFVFIASVS